ncbi:DMT family transporter [Marinobacter nauticus]|uniref:DMT family transporter n=1 Tax=Marinobacter nauticus TaxID=2743 RepID=UPI001CFCD89B|nr:DMT family transporter [Marinobacter nauticus]
MLATTSRFSLPLQAVLWGLLLINGFLIALMLALAKAATSLGLPAVAYAFWQTLIAGVVLLLCSGERRAIHQARFARYFLVSGLTGIAVPNAIGFFLVTKLGAGYTGIMYALPPIFTFLLAWGLGLENRNWLKLAGLSIAVMACGWIVVQRHAEMSNASPLLFVLGLAIPVMLSVGNVYRSVAWPAKAKPMILAAGTLLASALALALFAAMTNTELLPSGTSPQLIGILMLQGLLTALTYLVAFELQRRAGPVFYSQLGAVAAVFGLLIGVVWFREQYSAAIWLGVFLVILGLRISNHAAAPAPS